MALEINNAFTALLMGLVCTNLDQNVLKGQYLFLDADREITAVRNLSSKGLIRSQRRFLGQ